MRIVIINGPNLNLLGKREPEIYGNQSFQSYLKVLERRFPHIEVLYYQTNHEGRIIDLLHEFGFNKNCGIVLNPGAYTHTSIAISDAIRSISTPVVEVHLTEPAKREAYRTINYITPHCIHSIQGKGLQGYADALQFYSKNSQ
ncbi:MAG: 3-dehydroquinate dehydratase [Saprospirales bacterium]|nr:MAG: 3-dehydroquinate dehydratase [Saprospirales bacterium]